MQAKEAYTSIEEAGEQLLPGIPDEITLHQIASRLPWRVFHILSSVSPAWLRAIRTHQVHNARVYTQSAEALLLVTDVCPGSYHDPPRSKGKANFDDGITLYSMTDNTHSQLPPIPGLRGRIPPQAQCIALDGKVYLLGGEAESSGWTNIVPSNKVYVLDLAGQRQWKECTSMREPRMLFGCGVIHGKIYVFGGISAREQPLFGSEVYDPEENVWSPIRPMRTLRFEHCVVTVGEELFLHGGKVFDPDFESKMAMGQDYTLGATFLDVYHPMKDEWRVVKPFGRYSKENNLEHSPWCREVLFRARDRFYSLSQLGIYVHDAVADSWRHLHSISSLYVPLIGLVDTDMYWCQVTAGYPVVEFFDGVGILLYSVLAVNDEVLVVLYWYNQSGSGFCLVQSRGFGSANEEIVWQRAHLALSFAGSNSALRLIQL